MEQNSSSWCVCVGSVWVGCKQDTTQTLSVWVRAEQTNRRRCVFLQHTPPPQARDKSSTLPISLTPPSCLITLSTPSSANTSTSAPAFRTVWNNKCLFGWTATCDRTPVCSVVCLLANYVMNRCMDCNATLRKQSREAHVQLISVESWPDLRWLPLSVELSLH